MRWTARPTRQVAFALIGLGAVCAAAYFGGRWGPLAWYYAAGQRPAMYAGSASCRQCHEKFYSLWSTSNHGQSMVEFNPDFAGKRLSAQPHDIQVGPCRYLAQWNDRSGWVVERGEKGEAKYPIQYAIGGKNVYYFLTPLDGGKLQVLPLAYDVRRKEWYDMAASGVRHFAEFAGEPVGWKEWPYTFNTACYNCHVSQSATNYDVAADRYHTVWAEPGINCETCHGPSSEHIRLMTAAPAGWTPADPKLRVISQNRGWSAEEGSDSCAICHAKLSALTADFRPGDRYFDHFDLSTLENPDFYADGRDLGENYTLTTWRMSPCAKSGRLDCLACHTSSGRYRFQGDRANDACASCHQERVAGAAAHSHHLGNQPDSPTCVSCHMPTTEFARMRRTDHSMRPPMPAATAAFKSPNACNQCHADKDTAWADGWVRQWHRQDYQAPTLRVAGLIAAGRKEDWSRLPEMLDYLKRPDRDEVFANSLVRLLALCQDGRAMAVVLQRLKDDPSPLVRGSAARLVGERLSRDTIGPLAAACSAPDRLVRVRAAAALTAVPGEAIPPAARQDVEHAVAEYLESLKSRPDDGFSHYNLGNYYAEQAQLAQALASYDIAHRLRPESVMPLVNASLVLNRLGQNDKAEAYLRQAAALEPGNAVPQLNLGMLLAEMKRPAEAEAAFRAAVAADPKSAQAAYNLGLLLARDRAAEAIEWLQTAHQLRPAEPRYAYALAFHLNGAGRAAQAAEVLLELMNTGAADAATYALLGQVYQTQGKTREALEVYRRAAGNIALSERDRADFAARLGAIPPR